MCGSEVKSRSDEAWRVLTAVPVRQDHLFVRRSDGSPDDQSRGLGVTFRHQAVEYYRGEMVEPHGRWCVCRPSYKRGGCQGAGSAFGSG